MFQRITFALALVALALAAPAASSASWTLVDLGLSGTASYDFSAAINNFGNVAYTGVGSGGASQGFFYQKSNASTTNVGWLYNTYPQAYTAGINDSNQVVGYSLAWFGGAVDNIKNHAFVWAPGKQITDLTPQELNSDWADMHAYSINSRGMVAGDEYNLNSTPAPGYENAAIWDANAQLAKGPNPTTDAPTTWINVGSTTWKGVSINDAGHVIGSGKQGLTFKNFYYDGTTATNYWGGIMKYGWALNNAGIGVVSNTTNTYVYDGTNLVTLANSGGPGYQYAINNAATPQVVGTDGATASIYTKVNATTWSSQTVAAYAAGLGANTSAWTSLNFADGINNFGEIVGFGTTAAGASHAFALLRSDAPLAGDSNFDGKVDINDLSKVLTSYDKTGMTWGSGDFNGDGKVDINDLSIVLTNYDRSLGSSALGVAPVPEPGTLALLAVGLVGLLVYRRSRRG